MYSDAINFFYKVNRDKERVTKRVKFVKRAVKASKKGTTHAIRKIADRLFLSENTIWKDYLSDNK